MKCLAAGECLPVWVKEIQNLRLHERTGAERCSNWLLKISGVGAQNWLLKPGRSKLTVAQNCCIGKLEGTVWPDRDA